nr:MAG TPA: hypothetical protein [Ackermannviridae sp.]
MNGSYYIYKIFFNAGKLDKMVSYGENRKIFKI